MRACLLTWSSKMDTLSSMPELPSSRSFGTRAWVAVVIVVGMAGYFLGASNLASGQSTNNTRTSIFQLRGIGSRPPDEVRTTADFDQFWDLWKLLKTKYYQQPVDEEKMFHGAMAGLVASLGDPYTVYFEPEIAKEFSQSLEGKFEGIGAEIGMKDGQLQIVAPLPDSPADKAGLLPGDAILGIDATSTEKMTVERAVSLIRGTKGTNVNLSIGRLKTLTDDAGAEKTEAKQFDVSIIRDTIVVKSVRTKFMRDGIALIEITSFNSDTSVEFAKAVEDVLAKESKGLILDLRNDPGGFLDRATAVAGEWVGNDIVVIERRQGVTVDEYRGTGRGKLKGMPTVVLVNEGSASASEIVAGALQDYGLATLIGKKTFGKGSVQDYTELEGGTAVKITIAEWLTPKGRFINEIGIEPDITIERTEEDYHAERDPQLEKALEHLTGTATSSTSTTGQTP